MTEDELYRRLGLLIDKADNYLAYRGAHMPAQIKLESYTFGLQELRDELKRLYFDLGGDDVWDQPIHAHAWHKEPPHD
jgi:hypothetical protein